MGSASSRSFGLLIAFVSFGCAALSYWAGGHVYVYWAPVAAVFLVISILMPRVLAPLKRLWLKLGKLMHVIISPIVVGLTFLVAIIPVGLLIRLTGKDLLSLRRDASADSYWVKRPAGGPAPESLREQF